MSDQPRGDGWWQASDGRWYPPELHPDDGRSQTLPPPANEQSEALAPPSIDPLLPPSGASQQVSSPSTTSPADEPTEFGPPQAALSGAPPEYGTSAPTATEPTTPETEPATSNRPGWVPWAIAGGAVAAVIVVLGVIAAFGGDGDGGDDAGESPPAPTAGRVDAGDPASTEPAVDDPTAPPPTDPAVNPPPATEPPPAEPGATEPPPSEPAASVTPASTTEKIDASEPIDDVAPCGLIDDETLVLDVTNQSSGLSSYIIDVVFLDGAGEPVADEPFFVNFVRPGERTVEEAVVFDSGGGASCEIADVQRFDVESSGDLSQVTCEVSGIDFIGDITATFTVSNSSAEMSNYVVSAALVRDGIRNGTAFGFIENVRPGETAVGDGFSTVPGPVDGVTCEVVQVDRTSPE